MIINPTIKLGEYSTVVPSFESKSLGYNVSVDENLAHLKLEDYDKKLLEGQLKNILQIIALKDGPSIVSNSYIGVAKFSNFTVVVEPKILINPRNLFGMINYIFDIENWDRLPDAPFYFEKPESYLIEIIILLFVEETKRLLKKGLSKSYVTYQDQTTYVRGKLLLIQNMHNFLKNRSLFACEFDELEYDNLENQLILFCLHRAYKLTQSEVRKSKIRKLLMQLSDQVSSKILTIHDLNKIHYTRLNSHYKKTHELCRIIMESAGISDFYSGAKHIISSFFVDMNEIFEKFVFKLYDEFYYPERFNVIEQKKYWAWKIDFSKRKSIRTDILLEDKYDKSTKIVIDTKYKSHLNEADLYQIGFYIHEYSPQDKEISKTGYAILPKSVEDLMSGHIISSTVQNIHIIQRHIDLDYIIPLLSSKLKNKKSIREYLNEIMKIPGS